MKGEWIMEKWYLSDNGKVNGPYSIDDVQPLVTKNSDLYGWNPSYSHWLPVVKIEEFKHFVSQVDATAQISKELIDKFVNKKQELVKKITFIDSVVEKTTRAIARFDDEINEYKELTKQFDTEIQENIIPLEKKYNSILKQMSDIKKATLISKKEIEDAVADFGALVLNNTTNKNEGLNEFSQTSTVTPKTSPKLSAKDVEPITKKLPVDKNSSSVVPIRHMPQESAVTQEPQHPSARIEESQLGQHNTTDTNNKDQYLEAEKKSFKDKLKSVFAKEADVESSFSERLLQLDKDVEENKEDIVFLDYETDSDEADDGEPKIKHRRRR